MQIIEVFNVLPYLQNVNLTTQCAKICKIQNDGINNNNLNKRQQQQQKCTKVLSIWVQTAQALQYTIRHTWKQKYGIPVCTWAIGMLHEYTVSVGKLH